MELMVLINLCLIIFLNINESGPTSLSKLLMNTYTLIEYLFENLFFKNKTQD